MGTEWMTIQQFISVHGVFEVELETETKRIRCNCPVWEKKHACKHTSFVEKKIRMQGHYSISVSVGVPEEWAIEASQNPESFREFVVNYATIEVL